MKNGCIVNCDGTQEWFKDGKRHREDGPAIEYEDGTEFWFLDGKQHRADGPAVEHANGAKYWYYKDIYAGNGDQPEPVLWARLTSTEANGGPLLNGCVVDFNGYGNWFKDGQLHREDGPAIVDPYGYEEWCFNGKRLGFGATGFWKLWDRLTAEQRANPTLLKHLPR